MSREDWLLAYEALLEELGREPTEKEIREHITDEIEQIFEPAQTDLDVYEQMYGEYDDDETY